MKAVLNIKKRHSDTDTVAGFANTPFQEKSDIEFFFNLLQIKFFIPELRISLCLIKIKESYIQHENERTGIGTGSGNL